MKRFCIVTSALLLIIATPVFASVWIPAGDMGPSNPATMTFDRNGLKLTVPDSYVYSNGYLAFPSEFVGATTIRATIYFSFETASEGDINCKILLDYLAVGEQLNNGSGGGGYALGTPVAAGSPGYVYTQVIDVPTYGWDSTKKLLGFAISRDLYGGSDTCPDAIDLLGINLESVAGSAVEGDSPPSRDLGLKIAPNPFNPTTKISFNLPEDGPVSVHIFDLRGKLVNTLMDQEEHKAGPLELSFRPDAPSGVYFVQVIANGRTQTIKTTLVK